MAVPEPVVPGEVFGDYVSIYAYASEEPDDLQFDVGVTIAVTR